jgi:hypothetical protein
MFGALAAGAAVCDVMERTIPRRHRLLALPLSLGLTALRMALRLVDGA